MLAKLLAAALSSCCLAIPVTFKVQGLFEQCRSHVLWRSDGMRRTLDLRHKTPQTLSPVRRSALSLRLRSSQADFRGRQAAPGGPRLVGSFQSWNIPSAVATRQQHFLLCALCVWSAKDAFWGSATASFSQCTKALADDDADGIYAALLAHAGSFRMRDFQDALRHHQVATLDLPAGSYESLA